MQMEPSVHIGGGAPTEKRGYQRYRKRKGQEWMGIDGIDEGSPS